MKKALIFTAKIDYTGLPSNFKFGTYDNIIAADAGYDNALECGFIPDIIIGDFDSTNSKNTLSSNDLSSKVIVLPCEKDMTDAEAALDEAVNLGCDDILIIGGLNSRFDHTMGIICILAKYASSSISIKVLDGENLVRIIKGPVRINIEKNNYKYLGLISYGGVAEGISSNGLKYELKSMNLHPNTSLGVSNEIISNRAEISLEKGMLLVIQSEIMSN